MDFLKEGAGAGAGESAMTDSVRRAVTQINDLLQPTGTTGAQQALRPPHAQPVLLKRWFKNQST